MTSLEDYQWLFRKAPAMATAIGDDGRYLDVNDAFLERLGLRRRDMMGRRPGEFVTAVDPKIILISGRVDPKGPAVGGKRIEKFYRKLKSDYRYYSTARNGWIRLRFGAKGLDVRTMR